MLYFPAMDEAQGGFSGNREPALQRTVFLSGFRAKIIAAGAVFFVVALALSGSFLFFGQGMISGDNIAIVVKAPEAVRGGDTASLSIAIANRNAVAVESATLIIAYPSGTQEAGSEKELFRERIPLGNIAPGDTLNTSVNARLFGEENEEKVMVVSVEYRVEGSNATFFKEAEPARVRIGLSPVTLKVEGITEVSSGAEFTLTLSVTSNASSPLENVLIAAEYPFGFAVSELKPKPVKGQNVWRVPSLAPGAEEKVSITGTLAGGAAEERTFHFSAGAATERDRFVISSTLATASAGVTLTNPFVGLAVTMNGSREGTLSVGRDDTITVSIMASNTLADTVYDGVIIATLSGSGLDAGAVSASQGFFNSSSKTITWDRRGVAGLAALAPGGSESVSFTIRGASAAASRTPEVSFSISFSGRRVSESAVPQTLTNALSRTIRFESTSVLSSRARYSTGLFVNSGPVPPRAERTTTYTIELTATNGSNDLAAVLVTTALPHYVSWGDAVSPGADVSYNAATREVSWRIGTLGANASAQALFQVALLPSVSQVGSVPILLGEQRLRAQDRFTGSVLRTTAAPITTALSDDPNSDAQSGSILPKE